MKDRIKAMIIMCFIAGIALTYILGYFAGQSSINEGVQLEPVDDSIRFVFTDDIYNMSGIWKAVYHNDGSFIGFAIYDVDSSFQTFVHINETIKAKISDNNG